MPGNLAVEIPRKVWTREEAHTLADLGFPNSSRLELVDGDLIDHMGKKLPHSIWQHLILAWLQSTFGVEYAQMELPIDVAEEDNLLSEPEPDLVVTTKRLRDYKTNPPPEDLLLLIEVSDSTVNYDLQKKAPIYARAAITEYWVINIPDKLVHVHRNPLNGAYTSNKNYRFDEQITPVAKPDAAIRLDRL